MPFWKLYYLYIDINHWLILILKFISQNISKMIYIDCQVIKFALQVEVIYLNFNLQKRRNQYMNTTNTSSTSSTGVSSLTVSDCGTYNVSGLETLDASAVVDAINTAIMTAYNNGGGSVCLAPGNYVISEAIRMMPNVKLTSANIGACRITIDKDIDPNQASNGANIILIQPSLYGGDLSAPANIVIENLILDFDIDTILASGAFAQEWRERYEGAALDNAGNVITGRGADGNYLERVVIRDCQISNAAFHGIALYELVKNVSIYQNTIEDCGFRAAHLHGTDEYDVQEVKVISNIAKRNGRLAGTLNTQASLNGGIYAMFHNVKKVFITDNIVQDDKGVAIHCWGTAKHDGSTIEDLVVSNNHLIGCGSGLILGNNIKRVTCSNINVYGCRSEANGGGNNAKGRGLEISGTYGVNENMLVSDINISDCDGGGFIADNVDGFVFSGMNIRNNNLTNEGQAVVLQDVKNGVLSNSVIENNGIPTGNYCVALTFLANRDASVSDVSVTNCQIINSPANTAPPVRCLGNTNGVANSQNISFTGNVIRRKGSPSGKVMDMDVKTSKIYSNDVLPGQISVKDLSTNTVSDNV